MHMRFLLRLFPLLLAPALTFAQGSALDGHWEGAVKIPGADLLFHTDFSSHGDSISGTIDIPQQGARGLALQNIHLAGADVHFELPTGGPTAVFDGKLVSGTITGNFKQGGFDGAFSMKAGSIAPLLGDAPVADYRSEDVTFSNGHDTLAGTLTIPLGNGPHPAIVLVTGSGPQNRNEEIFGFSPFLQIANALTSAGVAVLRYDDRGVGQSTGNFATATTADFADDALAAVRYLQSRSEIDAKRIGMLGHSEGGEIAPMVANRSSALAFVVLMAGPGLKGSEIINAQVASMIRATGRSEEEVRQTLQFQERLYAALRSGKGVDELEEEVRATARKQIAALPAVVRDTLDTARVLAGLTRNLEAARSPWFRYFIDADPAVELRRLKVPVLALFGELDMQVPAAENKAAIAAALKKSANKDVTIRVIPKANHLFQEAHTGLPTEYATLPKKFAPGFLDELTKWVVERSR
jgi:dienelactone hydrolase